MFKTNIPPFIMTAGEEFEPGGGGDAVSEVMEGIEAAESADTPQPNESSDDPNPFSSNEGNEESGFNPAWNPVLDEIPQEFHNKIAPHLSEWDRNYHAGLEKARNEVQSQYEPYQLFVDNEISPELLTNAYQVYQAIENNPEAVIQALQQALGGEEPEGQGEEEGEEFYDANSVANDPRYLALEEKFNNLVEGMESREQQEAFEAEIDQARNEIDSAIEVIGPKFKEHFGFDMNTEEVLRIAISAAEENDSELDLMAAAQHFGDMVSKYRTPEPQSGFKAMPTSGGVPSTNVDVTQLSSEESKDLVAKMLREAQAQGGN